MPCYFNDQISVPRLSQQLLTLRACALQGGLNCSAVGAEHGSHLTCKDSLLVGWGGGTDQDNMSCPVAGAWFEGTQLDMDR
jgi:hypothetical protein